MAVVKLQQDTQVLCRKTTITKSCFFFFFFEKYLSAWMATVLFSSFFSCYLDFSLFKKKKRKAKKKKKTKENLGFFFFFWFGTFWDSRGVLAFIVCRVPHPPLKEKPHPLYGSGGAALATGHSRFQQNPDSLSQCSLFVLLCSMQVRERRMCTCIVALCNSF